MPSRGEERPLTAGVNRGGAPSATGLVRRSGAPLIPIVPSGSFGRVRRRHLALLGDGSSASERARWIGGTPARSMTLRGEGADFMGQLWAEAAAPAAVRSPSVGTRAQLNLVRRLLRADVCVPDLARLPAPTAAPTLSAIVPFFGRSADELVATLSALLDTPEVTEVIVVDDASPEPRVASAAIESLHRSSPRAQHVSLLRLDTNRGPAGARNAGTRSATSDWLAFVDSGVVATPGWATTLLAVAELDDSALVAPRVRGPRSVVTATEHEPRLRDRYERVRSPLDLGSRPSPVRAGAAVSFVPSACLLVRRSWFDRSGGFDEALRYGEDVDLVWRIDRDGGSCRYVPEAEASHPARATGPTWLLQRVRYGQSLGPLGDRHPERVHPWSGSVATLLVVAAVGMAWRRPRTAVVLGAAAVGWTGRSALGLAAMLHRDDVVDEGELRAATQLLMRAQAPALRGVLRALRRPYLPIALAASGLPVSGRTPEALRGATAALLAAAYADCATELYRAIGADNTADNHHGRGWRAREAAALTTVAVADDLAYSVGVWTAALASRQWRVLVPKITEFSRRRFG